MRCKTLTEIAQHERKRTIGVSRKILHVDANLIVRRRKTLVGYVPFDRVMDTSPRFPSRCHQYATILQFQLGRIRAAVVASARPPCGRSAGAKGTSQMRERSQCLRLTT